MKLDPEDSKKFPTDRFYITVDAVVFTILNGELKLLLVERGKEPYKGKFAVPGGFVKFDEEIDTAVRRELAEETNVKDIYLKQLLTIADVDRDPRGRIVTIPFLALIDGDKVKLHATTDAALAKWSSVYALPSLAFDHKKIVDNALETLRFEIQNTNIAFQIMPDEFTLTELQNAYEIILDKKLDKRNFRKKLKELNLLKELPGTKMEGAHRPAKLYSFRERRYRKLS